MSLAELCQINFMTTNYDSIQDLKHLIVCFSTLCITVFCFSCILNITNDIQMMGNFYILLGRPPYFVDCMKGIVSIPIKLLMG